MLRLCSKLLNGSGWPQSQCIVSTKNFNVEYKNFVAGLNFLWFEENLVVAPEAVVVRRLCSRKNKILSTKSL